MAKVTMEFQRCFEDYKFSISRIVVEVTGTDEIVNGFHAVLEGIRNGDANITARPVSVKAEENEKKYDLRFFYFDK
jgi:hypothetical protein